MSIYIKSCVINCKKKLSNYKKWTWWRGFMKTSCMHKENYPDSSFQNATVKINNWMEFWHEIPHAFTFLIICEGNIRIFKLLQYIFFIGIKNASVYFFIVILESKLRILKIVNYMFLKLTEDTALAHVLWNSKNRYSYYLSQASSFLPKIVAIY